MPVIIFLCCVSPAGQAPAPHAYIADAFVYSFCGLLDAVILYD